MSRIAIILINYNSSSDTIECLESIKRARVENESINVIIIDNASKPDARNTLCSFGDKYMMRCIGDNIYKFMYYHIAVYLILSEVNRGYSGGNNVGLIYAHERLDPHYYWLLNNDTVIDDNTIVALVQFSKEHPQTIVGSTILSYYDRETVQCCAGFKYNDLTCHQKMLNAGMPISKIGPQSIHNIDCISGCSMFFDNATLALIGYLDEDYFLYYEEINLKKVCKMNGVSKAWCPDAIIWHKEGGSTGIEASGKKSEISEYYGNISCLTYYYKYYYVLYFIIRTLKYIKKYIEFKLIGDNNKFKILKQSYRDFDKDKHNINVLR